MRVLPSLPVREALELSSDDSWGRSVPTKLLLTPHLSAIHLSDLAPHSGSFSSVSTARRLSSFVRRSPWKLETSKVATVDIMSTVAQDGRLGSHGHYDRARRSRPLVRRP